MKKNNILLGDKVLNKLVLFTALVSFMASNSVFSSEPSPIESSLGTMPEDQIKFILLSGTRRSNRHKDTTYTTKISGDMPIEDIASEATGLPKDLIYVGRSKYVDRSRYSENTYFITPRKGIDKEENFNELFDLAKKPDHYTK